MQKKLSRAIMAMVFAGFISGMAAGPAATPAWAAGQAFDQDQQAPMTMLRRVTATNMRDITNFSGREIRISSFFTKGLISYHNMKRA